MVVLPDMLVFPVTIKLLLIVVKPDVLNEFCILVLPVITTLLLNILLPLTTKLELILIELPRIQITCIYIPSN